MNASARDTAATPLPTRAGALSFWLRSRGLIALRALRNLGDRELRRWSRDTALAAAPVLAESRTPLWRDGRDDEFVLVAGKVHNLRIAARRFDGTVVPAAACLSFWRQLGRPLASRGFVRGRELRGGCVVPVVAGGICQLSNALAGLARDCGFEFVEHHRHSVRIADGAPDAPDATVFWNYLDLRLRAPHAWRLEVALDADDLVVRIRAELAPPVREAHAEAPVPRAAGVRAPRGCLSCDESGCFRHRPALRGAQAREAWLLDAWTPEFAAHLATRTGHIDRFAPTTAAQWRRPWATPANGWTGTLHERRASLCRLAWARWHAASQGRRQAAVIDGQRWLATALAARLRPEHVRLVVAQSLLPHLFRLGVLGGRRHVVLADALPMDEIERRLDEARRHAVVPAAATLADFRVDAALREAEYAAFACADAVVTAHADVARHWRARGIAVELLPWQMPHARARDRRGSDAAPLVVLAASALARKGAYELAAALRGLRCRLRVLGSPSSDASLWQDIEVEYAGYAGDWVECARVVVLPAHVEHAPRALLRALAAGIPVIATAACGIDAAPTLRLVPAGDVGALRSAILAAIEGDG